MASAALASRRSPCTELWCWHTSVRWRQRWLRVSACSFSCSLHTCLAFCSKHHHQTNRGAHAGAAEHPFTPAPEQSSARVGMAAGMAGFLAVWCLDPPDLETLFDKHPRCRLKKCPAPSGWSACKAVGAAEIILTSAPPAQSKKLQGHFFNRRRGHLSNKVSRSGGSKHMVLK